jgi:hypothetical protein
MFGKKKDVSSEPNISFDVFRIKEGERKSRQLVLNRSSLKCLNGGSTSFQYDSSDVFR